MIKLLCALFIVTIVCACSTGRGTTTYDKPDGVANFICIRFQQIDLNQDGYIDYLEFHGLPISQRPDSEHIFVAIDSNQDGKVSRREADDYLRPMSKR